MKKLPIKIGQKFGRLTVVEILPMEGKRRYCMYLCECGNNVKVRADVVGKTTYSCGCLAREKTKERTFVHGDCNSRIYRIWEGMRQRCRDKNASNYHNYGGRGIKVCPEWSDNFIKFRNWSLENGYKEKLTIDRINNNGDYTPDNCQWTTIKQQSKNRRNNLKYKGEISSDASFRLGGKTRHLVSIRILKGWPIEKAFTTPCKTKL